MKLSGIQKRAQRRERNKTALDMNLVSLIDVFTILIFFLLFNLGPADLVTPDRPVRLPASTAEAAPRETVVVTISKDEIAVGGRTVARVADVMAQGGDLIEGLRSALQQLQPRTAGAAAPARAVTILGDREIPYRLLRKVMATCAQADFADVSFALNRKVAS
jgi:biopolymer transport protein ExbD